MLNVEYYGRKDCNQRIVGVLQAVFVARALLLFEENFRCVGGSSLEQSCQFIVVFAFLQQFLACYM